jgi:hypothetical protein
MPKDDAPIKTRKDLSSDTDDVTAVKAPPPGLIRESKILSPAEVHPAATELLQDDTETPPLIITDTAEGRAPVPRRTPAASIPLEPRPRLPLHDGARHNNDGVRADYVGPTRPAAVQLVPLPRPRALFVPAVPVGEARRGGSSGGFYGVVALALLAGAGFLGWREWSVSRSGKLEISTIPSDAIISVGGTPVGDRSPVVLERPPGVYSISVAREGYARSDQSIDLRAGQVVVLPIRLTAAIGTGVEVASEPSGVPVWVDGARAMGAGEGSQTYPIPPGKHVIEIRGDARYKPWREEVEIESGTLRSFRVQLARSDSSGSSRPISSGLAAFVPRRLGRVPGKREGEGAVSAPGGSAGARERERVEGAGAFAAPGEPRPPGKGEETRRQQEDSPPAERLDTDRRDQAAGGASNALAAVAVKPALPVLGASPAPAPPPAAASSKLAARAGSTGAARTISGRVARDQLLIDPNTDEYRVKLPPALARAGMKVSAVVRICVSAQGTVSDVRILKSADPSVDPEIPAVLGKWRYRPLIADGQPAPFCYVLQYGISAR